MKKITLAAAILGLLASGAAVADDSTGCGLGTMLFDGKSGAGFQVLAVTTNGTLGNQTFGISSGTLGCDSDATITSNAKMSMYVGNNMESLAQNMSVGGGESLTTLADMMGIAPADRAAFYTATQTHFNQIFPTADTQAKDVVSNLHAMMAKDAALAKYTA